MTWDDRVKAIADHGFTERQASFLVTVMLHSGVCLGRNYSAYARIAHGARRYGNSSTSCVGARVCDEAPVWP